MTPALFSALVISLVLLGSLSPMLTFAALFQQKEWRIDRLLEHLQHEGFFFQLFGKIRPILALLFFLVEGLILYGLLQVGDENEGGLMMVAFGGAQVRFNFLIAFAVLSVLQIVLRKQRSPVWTAKAKLIVLLSLMVTAFAAWSTPFVMPLGHLFILVLQPIVVLAAWFVLKPFDVVLKIRILNRAKFLRRAQPNLTVIGITGSVGKTTTKELLAHILKSKGVLSTPLHVNTELGVSKWLIDTLQKEPTESERILIIEMGAYKKGEIKLLCSITQPSLGIITAVGRQHLGLFGSAEAIVEAKGELFEALPKTGHAFGNKDNAAFNALKTKCSCPLTSVGTAKGADLQALDIEETGTGIRFSLEGTIFFVPLFGTHTVTSILLAIAVAKHLKVPMQEIAEALRTFQGMKQTFEVKTVGEITVLDDTYNASPESFRAATEWAARQPHKKKVLVTEGIIELGKEEESIHRELAGEAAKVFDLAFVTHERTLPYFKHAFGDKVALTSLASTLQPRELLVCIGRIPKKTIDRFVT